MLRADAMRPAAPRRHAWLPTAESAGPRSPASRPPDAGSSDARASDARACGTRSPVAESRDCGSSIVEFSLVAILLVTLLLGILQVAFYLYIRNVATASAAEGARYAANADVPVEAGAERAKSILEHGVGSGTASHLTCTGGTDEGSGGVALSLVRCTGAIPVFFVPAGDVLLIDVTGHAVEEGAVAPGPA